jgi:antibiotic biosynthesis monooxygenase (ABM) superfamily enzyme
MTTRDTDNYRTESVSYEFQDPVNKAIHEAYEAVRDDLTKDLTAQPGMIEIMENLR